jgi:flavin-dependent dehydrogenase
MENSEDFDIIIVGGSYAGLSAAMALGRALRNVLIIDSGKPCNIQTPHSHNFITQDGKGSKSKALKSLYLLFPSHLFRINNSLTRNDKFDFFFSYLQKYLYF